MSLWDDLTGRSAADASNAAAADTYAKQQAATAGLTNYASGLPGQYADIGSQYAGLGAGYKPYAEAGGSALKQLMGGLGLGGGDPGAFTAAYRGLPGYQAGLDTGTKAVAGKANAGNMFQSGATLKALQRYGSDYEDQRSGDYLSRLMGVAGMGQQATGAQAALGAQGLGTQTQGLNAEAALRQSAFGGEMNSAGTIGQGQVAGAQAQQQGLSNLLGAATYLGGAALGGGVGGGAGGLAKSAGGGLFGLMNNNFMGAGSFRPPTR